MILCLNDREAGITADKRFNIMQVTIAIPIIIGLNSMLNVMCVFIAPPSLKIFNIQSLEIKTTIYDNSNPATAPIAVRARFSQTTCNMSEFFLAPNVFLIPISHSLFSMRLDISPHKFRAGTNNKANIIICRNLC